MTFTLYTEGIDPSHFLEEKSLLAIIRNVSFGTSDYQSYGLSEYGLCSIFQCNTTTVHTSYVNN